MKLHHSLKTDIFYYCILSGEKHSVFCLSSSVRLCRLNRNLILQDFIASGRSYLFNLIDSILFKTCNREISAVICEYRIDSPLRPCIRKPVLSLCACERQQRIASIFFYGKTAPESPDAS